MGRCIRHAASTLLRRTVLLVIAKAVVQDGVFCSVLLSALKLLMFRFQVAETVNDTYKDFVLFDSVSVD